MKGWTKTQAKPKKRNSFWGTSSNNSADEETDDDIDEEEEHASGEVYHAERFLSNKDYYTGYWVDNFPHGAGQYFWTDGCSYTGDWFRGKKMGKGTFKWPSGAKYEGNFKSGFMDGDGTYIGLSGDSYRGSWVMNMKHGFGVKEYTNGDVYNGEWTRGLQNGQGMYRWKNENFYVGEWRNGAICGGGKLGWKNGNTYEGDFEDGLPKGYGKFQWKDGGCCEGNWSKNPNEQSVTYHPSGSSIERDPQDVYNVYMKECVVSPSEKVPILPSQKKLAVWMSSKMVDSSVRGPRRRSVDGRIEKSSVVVKEFGRIRTPDEDVGPSNANTYAMDNHIWSDGEGLRGMIPRIGKRQGVTIYKGHKNFELMLNLQLGVRHSAGKGGPPPSLNLRPSAFDPKEKFWTKFPPEGTKHTPPHASCEFKWKDYCPKVFRSLRLLFNVDPADYMLSICGDNALRELSSPGKSGSFFYLTHDDRYMIKTIKKAEVKVLLRMLSSYYNHVRDFEHSLVTKYFGLHCVKLSGTTQKKVRFVIMGNLFCTSYTIHRRYDLKGSTFGRITMKPDSGIDSNTTLKDLDLNFIFRLQTTWFKEFRRQVDRDCELLEQERIMDYSLLVGLHFIEKKDPQAGQGDGVSSMKLGISMPTRVERTERNNSEPELQLVGDPTGEYYDVVMFFGIIDILQDYDITKKLEHAYKSMQYDPNSISAVDPKQYSKRFRDYIYKVFAEDFGIEVPDL